MDSHLLPLCIEINGTRNLQKDMSNFSVKYCSELDKDYKVVLGKFPYHSAKPYEGQCMPDFKKLKEPINMFMRSYDLAKSDAPSIPIIVFIPCGQGENCVCINKKRHSCVGKGEKPIEISESMATSLYKIADKVLLVMAQRILDACGDDIKLSNELMLRYAKHIHMVTKSCRLLPEEKKKKFESITGSKFVNYPEESHERVWLTLSEQTNVAYFMKNSLTDYALKEKHPFFLTNIEPKKKGS